MCETAEAIKISTEREHHILQDYLDIKKLSAWWVLQLLTIDHEYKGTATSRKCLAIFIKNTNRFLHHFITLDQTWIHHNTLETKEESKQWGSTGARFAQEGQNTSIGQQSYGNSVFWGAQGVIHIDYLENGKLITSQHYLELLDRFHVYLKKK